MEFRKRHDFVFNPEGSALLILDMQKYFLEASSHAYIPSASAIIPAIKTLIHLYSDRGLPLIFTRHINTPVNSGMMSRWWTDTITKENPLSGIADSMNTENAVVIDKGQYDAFFETPLESILKGKNITRIIVCGVMTHLCCETTARSAFTRGFEVFFTIDGTATYNKLFHMSALLNLSHGFAVPVLMTELIASFEVYP